MDIPYLHRDISWLSFNYRVLQEAKDPSVPLFERVKFLAIYSNNLDEFFRVRVANHRNLLRVGKKTKRALHVEPKKILKDILQIVNEQQEEFSHIFENEIIPELTKHNIYLLRRMELTDEEKDFVENYFFEKLLPFVQPVLLVKDKIRPFLNNAQLYLTVWLKTKDEPYSEDQYAIIKIPSDHLPRFVQLPTTNGQHHIIMLDDIVRHSLQWLFPGYDIQDTFSIKLTRDAELYIDDEFSGDLIAKIKSSLQKRNVGPASRFVFDRTMPDELLDFLKDSFDLTRFDMFPEGRYHNNFDFFSFPNFGYNHLTNTPLPPLPYIPLEQSVDFFESMREKDHLLHVPYHSYESVVMFFEKAARDPNVTHIKIVQYRVARRSRIMKALMNAVKAGKQVSVFIEVKARFDETANLEWGERLEAAGVKVNYSFPGVKVHSKLAMVIRQEAGTSMLYAYLSSGNFHEDTAKIYCDYGLFTTDTRLTKEVARVFSFLETVKIPKQNFEHLLVGQFNLRDDLQAFVEKETENALAGKKASIFLKMNSLQDEQMIQKLYEASQAGVKIKMIIRGICCLIPGVKGMSENIEVYSIVDRFLEHARVFIFHNDGDERMYLSSADWMVRNLSHRIETIFPIYDENIKEIIQDNINIQLNDNVKSRVIDEAGSNEYKRDDSDLAVRSQEETYYYFKRRVEAQLAEMNPEEDESGGLMI